MALIFVDFAQPSVATIPSLASTPTAIFRETPLLLLLQVGVFDCYRSKNDSAKPFNSQFSIVLRLRIPPPSCAGIFT